MNQFFSRFGNQRRTLYQVRAERVKREGSPYYTWKVPVTAFSASAAIHVVSHFPEARKYNPLDWIEIANNESLIDLTVVINGGESFLIPASTIRTLDGLALHHIAVTNNHASVSTTLGAVVVTVRREPLTIDGWARRQ